MFDWLGNAFKTTRTSVNAAGNWFDQAAVDVQSGLNQAVAVRQGIAGAMQGAQYGFQQGYGTAQYGQQIQQFAQNNTPLLLAAGAIIVIILVMRK